MSWPNECVKKAGVPAKEKRRKSLKTKDLRRFGGRKYNSRLVKRMSGGDRIRTCDLEVMSLAKKRRNSLSFQDLQKCDLSRSPPRSPFSGHGMGVERRGSGINLSRFRIVSCSYFNAAANSSSDWQSRASSVRESRTTVSPICNT